ncbi:MAG TPA: hypothetical protein VGG62_03330 [Terracidiphilus sp.]
MKVLLAIVAAVIVAASLFADYKWRRWMAARRAEHLDYNSGNHPTRSDGQ